ncbi:MAG TPA: hypothetical protein VGI82_04070 [Chitinophagaceae bacterium]|jgi:hypothetical protein
MKKFIVAVAAALTIVSASAFARTGNGDNPALETFQTNFKGALDVKWVEGKNVITASFVLGNTRTVAYFNYSGELLGTARNILYNQLPLVVITELNQRYSNSSVYDITEYTIGSETFYSMTAEMPKKQFQLKVSSTGDISVESKTKR